MASSPAQLEANRRNALRSTGPKTDEGKAVSRLNAVQHGLAGVSTWLVPGEDPRQVERRAKAFAAELGAIGDVGELLAYRAALLSIRMERSAERELVVIAANQQAARERFDQERIDDLGGWIENLDDPTSFRPALAALEAVPEGVAYLITTYLELRGVILADDGFAARQASQRAGRWLGLTDDEAMAMEDGELARLDVEVDRLRSLAAQFAEVEQVTAIHRERAAIIAGFDPTPEATLARRYEAAAERGMYRAIRAIAEIRRNQVGDLAPVVPIPTSMLLPPAGRLLEPPRSPQPELGSFRAGVSDPESFVNSSFRDALEPIDLVVSTRKKRPDLRKLALNRR